MEREPILMKLADYLQDRREAILKQFVAGVQIQPAISTTNNWSRPEIEDELSRLLDSLLAELRSPGASGPLEEALEEALAHGSHRWDQHYEQAELLGEFSIFREVLMLHIAKFEDQLECLDLDTRTDIDYIVHRFLDQLMIQGATRFAKKEADAPNRPAEG